MEKQYKISESRLKELLDAEIRLQALNFNGVDNWRDYDFSIEMYEQDYGKIWELAELGVKDFEEVV